MADEAEEVEPPRVVDRSEHEVSRRDIDPDALKILYRLQDKGFRGYLVGGGVRDLMLGLRPKDFDIATDASPRQLKRLFGNGRIIGRRFQLVHIHYPNGKIIEVATFRSTGESDRVERNGELIHRDNVFGTPSEDALRRDLTINGLFYDIATFAIIDYVGGFQDLEDGLVRMVGDPVHSFREDPVRMLRAIRHATRLGFEIERETRRALESEREEILKANEARLLEEFYKDLASGRSRPYFEELDATGFLELLLPSLTATFRRRGARRGRALLQESLERLDERHARGEEISHVLGLAALLSPLIVPVTETLGGSGNEPNPEPFREALMPALERVRVYRRDAERLWHVLGAWGRLERAMERESIPKSLSRRHYFPEALDVFELLSEPSDELDAFLELGRSLPPPTEEPPEPKRRPRRGGRGRGRGGRGGEGSGGAARARGAARSPAGGGERTSSQESDGGGGRRRRRRRRRTSGKRS